MSLQRVDHNAIKFSQVSTTVVIVLAFLSDSGWLVGLLALILIASTAGPQWGAFRLLYDRVVRPLGWIRPNVLADDPAPHRFAQGVGATVLVFSVVAIALGAPLLGWGLAWLVGILALVNVLFDFCVGCFIYHQLRRFGLLRSPQTG